MSVRGRRLTFVALFASATAGILAACTVFNGLHLPDANPADAAEDASGGEAATPPKDPCAHVSPAAEPAVDDDPKGDVGELVFALKSYGFDPTRGYDLDGVCTCDGGVETAHDSGPSCKGPVSCDKTGGIDNVLGELGGTYAAFITNVFAKLIGAGRRTGLVLIAGYNGLANDSDVKVALVDGAGIRVPGCASSTFDPARQVYSAGWCGLDEWSVDSRTVAGGGGDAGGLPLLIAQKAYVSNHKLVALITLPVPLPGSHNPYLTISAAIVTATLEPSAPDAGARDPNADLANRAFSVRDGLLAGRVSSTALLGWVGTQNFDDLPVCTNDGLFGSLKASTCGRADLNTSGNYDPTADCTDYSAGISFTAFPARRGSIQLVSDDDSPCAPGDGGRPVDASASYTCP